MDAASPPELNNNTPNPSTPQVFNYGSHLLPHHAEMLQASGISPEVIEARGYRSVTTKAELARLGFGRSQQAVPTLVIPIHGVTGEVSFYIHRPDGENRRNGRIVKYEIPAGAHMGLDVPPTIRPLLAKPDIPLFVTEGTKKADSAVSRGLCCISVIGVWNWRGSNEFGGKAALADWESIPLKDQQGRRRDVYLAFDSDAMWKKEVHQALDRFSEFIERRGGRAHFIYLPNMESGAKMGLDDFLAANHSVDELLSLASDQLRPLPYEKAKHQSPYRETEYGLVWQHDSREGPLETVLANFTARIAKEIVQDDGAETSIFLELQASCAGKERTIVLPAQTFAAMNWPIQELGPGAVLSPGQGLKDHARAAIQQLSLEGGEIPREHQYSHTGWRRLDGGRMVYLHAGGAIGGDPSASTEMQADMQTQVQLGEGLELYRLPDPPQGERLIAVVRASLRFLELAPPDVTYSLYASIWRAPLGDVDYSMYITGESGEGKTALAALAQQHYGPEMDARNVPGSWSSTDNALEAQLFGAKDALFTIDDYVPVGSMREVQRLHAKADRVLRAQGNRSGRRRMRADGSLRPTKRPRCLTLSTGEDVPPGHSLGARMLVLELPKGTLSWDILTRCQRDAEEGLYAGALAGYLAWLAPHLEERVQHSRERAESLRDQASTLSNHRRTPDIVASLATGIETFLDFAYASGAIDINERADLWARAWRALTSASSAQNAHRAETEPAARFLELLAAALASGKAHLVTTNGERPATSPALGWRQDSIEWRPQGSLVGWIDEENQDLFLIKDAACNVARAMGGDGGEGLLITPTTLLKRLKDSGVLKSVDKTRGTLTIRRVLDGAQRTVVHLRLDTILQVEHDKPDISANSAAPGDRPRTSNGSNVGFSMSGFGGSELNSDIRTAQHPTSARLNGHANVGNVGNATSQTHSTEIG